MLRANAWLMSHEEAQKTAEKGVRVAKWFETFFNGLYAKVLPNTFDESQTREDVRVLRRLLGLRKGHKVLDIPCGMGRLTIPLARTGLVMTGVDLTPSYVRRGQRQAKKESLEIRFIGGDMRDIAFDGEFDAAFNWFGSFGYFSDAENLQFCKRAYLALRPAGKFLIEGVNKSWLLAHFRPTHDMTIGGVHVVIRSRWSKTRNRVLSTWTFSKGKRTERHRISTRVFNGAEMRTILKAAGFREIALFGYPPLGRFTRHSQRLIAVGERPLRMRVQNR
jgi:SAM-dependent methyltransferase